MKQTKSTSKFALILIAILVVVFASAFSATLFGNSTNYVDSDLSVAYADCFHGSIWNATGAGTTSGTTTTMPVIYASQSGTINLSKSNFSTNQVTNSREVIIVDEGIIRFYTDYSKKDKYDSAASGCHLLDLSNIPSYSQITVTVNYDYRVYAEASVSETKMRSRLSLGNKQFFTTSSGTDSGANSTCVFGNEYASTGSTNQGSSSMTTSIAASSISNNQCWINIGTNIWRTSSSSLTRDSQASMKVTSITITITASSTNTFSATTGGSVSPTSVTFANNSDVKTSTATASTGYHFVNWTLGSTTITTNNPISLYGYYYPSGSAFTANFAANTYTINYNLNSGTYGSSHPTSGTYDTAFKVSAPTRSGYTFIGWTVTSGLNTGTAKWGTGSSPATAISSTTTYCANGESGDVYFKNVTATNGGSVTLTANWAQNYKITFTLNGGSETYDSTTSYDPYTVVSVAAPTRTGYKFTGWKVTSGLETTTAKWGTTSSPSTAITSADTLCVNGTSAVYFKALTKTASVTLSANWEAITYTITYDSNKPSGASASIGGSTANSTHTYDTAKALTANGYTLAGWTFSGWATTASGAKAYDNSQSVSNLTATNGATFTLYAHWTAKTYTVTYNANKPSGASNNVSGTTANSSHTYDTAQALTANGYSLKGWTFDGWATTASGAVSYSNSQSVSNLTATNGATFTLYAHWTAKTYAISYTFNSGTHGSTHPTSGTYDTAFQLSTPTRVGYAFTGWKVTSGLDTATAKWGTSSANTAIGTDTLCKNGSSNIYLLNINASSTAVTITANWVGIAYTITFAAGTGGSGSMSNQTGTYSGSNITIKSNAFTQNDAFFTGWKDDKNNSYVNGGAITGAILQSYQNGNPTVASVSITLTAQWWTGSLEFGADGSGSGKWGSSTNPYIIRTVTHLENLKTIVNGGTQLSGPVVGSIQGSTNATYTNPQATVGGQFSGCYFKLAASISANANSILIGTSSNPFKGTFDGNSETISNVSISTTAVGSDGLGLFGYINGATIKNLNVSATITVFGQSYVGAVVGYATSSTITNCSSSGSLTTSSAINTSATTYSNKSSDLSMTLIQWDYNKSSDGENIDKIFDNNTGTKIYTSTKTMSFIVDLGSLYKLTGFSFSCADDTSKYPKRNIDHVRIWGFTSNPNYTSCWTDGSGGKPTDSDPVSKGVTGAVSLFEDSVSMTTTSYYRQDFNLSNTGKYRYVWVYIKGKDNLQFSEFDIIGEKSDYLGGTIGYATSGSTISNCTNNATLNGTYNVGGIVGYTFSTVTGCSNTGTISAYEFVGGIVGRQLDSGGTQISNSYNTGNITATSNYAGGICGSTGGKIYYAVNTGNITAVNKAGGIAGNCSDRADYLYQIGGTITASSGNGGAIFAHENDSYTKYGYIIGTATVNATTTSSLGYHIQGHTSILPVVYSGSTYTTFLSWNLITANNFNGVEVTSTTSSGYYLKLTSDSLNGNTYFEPSNLTSTGSSGEYTINAGYNFTDSTKKNNIYSYFAQITVANNVKEYDAEALAITNSTQISGYNYEFTYANGKTSLVDVSDSTTASLKIYVTVNSTKVYVGEYANIAATINPIKIQVTYESATYTYDANPHNIKLKSVIKYSDASPCTITYNTTTQVVTIAITGSSTETVQISTTQKTNAGTYSDCVATYSIITGRAIGNYNFVKNGSYTLTINKRELIVSSPTWTDGNHAGVQNRNTDSNAFTYNGSEQGLNTFTIDNKLADANISYSGNRTKKDSNVKTGTSEYTYTISLADTANFTLSYLLGTAKTANVTSVTYKYKILQRSIQDATVVFTQNSKIFNSTQVTIGSNSYYTLNTSYSSYSTKPAVIYASALNDTSYKAYIKLYYNNIDELVSGTDYTALTDSSVPKLTNVFEIKKGTETVPSITINSIATGNYNGTCKIWFTLMGSDYGKLSSGTGVWGSSTNPYVISSVEHLLRLSYIVNSDKNNAWNSIVGVNSVPSTGANAATATDNTYANCYFEVQANVSTSKDGGFEPIGTSDKQFKAKQFNGDNFIITLTYVNVAKDYVGVFGYVNGTKFIDVKTAGTVSGKANVGALAGYLHGVMRGTFDNTANVTGAGDHVGGVIGRWDSYDQTEVSIIRGSNTGTINGVNRVGGAVGYINGPDSYSEGGFSCKDNIFDQFANSGSITATGTHGAGVVGYAYDQTYGKAGLRVYFIGCTNTASISAKQNAGGIVGYSRDAKIYGCVNGTSGTTATISATESSAGGIASSVGGYSILSSLPSGHTYSGAKENINYMAISATSYVGGVFGQASWASIGYLKNYGTVTATNDTSYAGGIVGYMIVNTDNVDSAYTLSESTNYASVTGKNYTAGIVGAFVISGSVKGYAKIQNVYNLGAITGKSYVGGIVGKMQFGNFAGTVRNTAIIKGAQDGQYIGGIAGHVTLAKAISSTNFESYGTYVGKDYVGGIIGYINTNGKAVSAKFISGLTYNSVNYSALQTSGKSSGETVVAKGKFGGNFFGYSEGNSTITFSTGTSSTGQIDGYESNIYDRKEGVCIGGVCGANINCVLDFRNLTTNFLSGFSIIGRTNQTCDVNGLSLTNAELAGGICGYNAGTIYLNAATTLSSSTIFVANDGKGKYVGGVCGYNAGSIENVKISINVGSNSSNSYKSSYAGAIAGYNSGTITNIISITGNVYGVDYVGGLVGYNTASITSTTSMTHSSVVNGNGTVGFVGGAVGYSSGTVELKNFEQTGAVSSNGSYIGGLIGYAADAKITNSKYSVTELSGKSYVGGIAGYWGVQSANAIDNSVTSIASIMGTGSFIGGIAGYVTVSGANLFTSYTPTLKNGTSLTVQGKSYVGGLFGYFKGGEYKLSTSGSAAGDTVIHIDNTKVLVKVTSVGTTASSKGDAIGGLFGYVASCGVVFDTNWSTSYAFTASGTGATFTTNANYVGGIAGIIGSNATLEYNASSSTGTNTVISNNMTFTITGDFVGGIAGYVSPYAGAYNQNLVYKFGDLIKTQNVTSNISGTNYVGGLYGYIGDSIEEVTYTREEVPITNTVVLIHKTTDLVGAVQADSAPAGYDSSKYCYFYSSNDETHEVTFIKYYYTSINSLTASTYNASTYVTPEIDERIWTINNDTYVPITYSIEVPTGSNEIIITEHHSGKTEFSALLSYKDATSIENTAYKTQIGSIENSGVRITSDMNYLVYEPKYAVNERAITASESYAGGLIGYVGTHTKLNLINSAVSTDKNDSDIVAALSIRNGNANKDANITAVSYCGGIAGYVSNEGHTIQNIVNIGTIGSATSTYVGGLVGKADGGSFVDSISTSKGHVTSAMTSGTNNYLGKEYVGGLFGTLSSGSVTNCYAMGFLFGTASGSNFVANTSSLKGGTIGYAGSSALITNTWAYYLASNISYSTNSPNTYGKYLLVEANSSVSLLPRFGELAYIAGIYTGTPQVRAASIASAASVAIQKGYISIGLNLYDTLPLGSQLAFYDANGLDRIYSEIDSTSMSGGNIGSRSGNVITLSKNQILYIKLNTSCASLIIDIVPITFSNIPVYSTNLSTEKTINDDANDTNEANLRAAYVRPSTYEGYDIGVFTATYGTDKYIKNINATINISIGANKYEIGAINKNITTGDEASPWLIDSVDSWNEFASKVRGGTSYSGQTVRLTKDLTGSDSLKNTLSNLAGSSSASFSGTFDGDGHTIAFTGMTANANGVSLFMNASGATFKNLTIQGSIAGNGYSNIAGYVGQPAGNVTFNNCTSKVEITNVNENAGGFVGSSNNVSKLTFLTCVNDAFVESKANTQPYYSRGAWRNTYAQVNYGTGGIIGQVASSTTISIDSCRNTANGIIVGGHNVGGIIGVAHATTNIYNCANSGSIWAVTGLSINSSRNGINGDHTKDAENVNSYRGCSFAGGIIGKLSGSGILGLYSSYNDGQVTGISNVVGGLVGGIGNITVGESGGADESTSAGMSYICYCYNTGLVQAGGTQAKYTPAWNLVGTIMNGTIVGGIIGFCGPAYVAYTYNTGRIISWSGASYGGWEYQARMGGIIGQSAPTDNNNKRTEVTNCYNVGNVELRVEGSYAIGGYHQNRVNFYYGGGIIGYLDAPFNSGNAKDYTRYSEIYSVKNCVFRPGVARKSGGDEWLDAGEAPTTGGVVSTGNRVSGTLVELQDLTATYTEEGTSQYNNVVCAVSAFSRVDEVESKKSGSAISMIDYLGNDIDYQLDTKFKAGQYYGWIYAYGCLPQLAMFALDTKEGLAMTSTSFGQDDYGNWKGDRAGSKESPYVIKDGIDLMLLSALNAAQYHNYFYTFEGKYIEFANGTNNIDNKASKTITLANSESTRTNNYKASDGTNTIVGKSYHLYLKGAVCNDRNGVSAGTAYTAWKNKNRYYNGSSWASGCPITTVNFYPIGMKGPFSYFGGNISGEQGTGGNTVIENVQISIVRNDSAYAGLFGYVQGANISYITVNGSIYGRTLSTQAYSANKGGEVMVGAIAGYAGANTTIEHCFAGIDKNKCTVTGLAVSENPNTYVGGVVGKTSTLFFDNSLNNTKGTLVNDSYNYSDRNSIIAGTEVNIITCESNANVLTPKNNVGGIVGYAQANGYNSTTTSGVITGSATKVRIQDCKVNNGTITAASRSTNTMTYGTSVGGFIGATDQYVEMTVSGGSIGHSENKSVSGTTNVTIIGENKVGGIIGSAAINDIIGVTGENPINIYGDVKITRGNSWGNVNNNIYNSQDYGVSIGGLVGFTAPVSDNKVTVVFAGEINSYAYVLVDVESYTGSQVHAVGGAIGYMGAGAFFKEGCAISIDGVVEIGDSIANPYGIGGIAGIANNVAFNGIFNVYSSIIATKAKQVGGFIGLSLGQTEILAGSALSDVGAQIKISAIIQAVSEVGGIVGEIQQGASLNIGSNSYRGSSYLGSLSIDIQDGSYIIASGNTSTMEANVGGIVGYNDGTVSIVKGTLGNSGDVIGGADVELPEGFQGLQYIQTTGSQYINTGIIPTNSTGMQIVISSQDVTTDLVYIGQRKKVGDNNNYRTWIGVTETKVYYGWNGLLNYNTALTQRRISLNSQYTLSMNFLNSRECVFQGEVLSSSLDTYSGTTYPIYIGTGNDNGTPYSENGKYSSIKIYSVKISEGSVIKHNYVPCKKTDGTVGLYDVIGRAFYASNTSTAFVAGPRYDYVPKDNVGGIVGLNEGTISFVEPSITNSGNVVGRNNIGGTVGYVLEGTIAGTFTNEGNVTGKEYVGGSFGKTTIDTVFTIPTVADEHGVAQPLGDSLFINKGNVTGEQYVGGSIGIVLGKIEGSSSYLVKFENEGIVTTGEITTAQYIGGSVGSLTGTVTYTSFTNKGDVTTKGYKAIGGSIGIVGMPSALVGTLHKPSIFDYVHFEFNSEHGLSVGPNAYDATKSATTVGGVGGIIGVILNAESFTANNSFYVLSSVSAPYLTNVGGSIGLIQGGTSIIVDGLLAYNTIVTGYQNVGGIVGAVKNNGAQVTIQNSFNVSIADTSDIVATVSSGKAYGGIVGYVGDTTKTDSSTSYWVKGFYNSELASLNIDNVKNVGHSTVATISETFSEVYSLASTVYSTFDDSVKYYTRSGSGTSGSPYTYKEATGVTAANYASLYVNQYKYSIGFCNAHPITDFLDLTGQEDLKSTVYSWDSYVTIKFNSEVNAKTVYQDGNGNFVRMTPDGNAFTTGDAVYGYYFLFAKDTTRSEQDVIIQEFELIPTGESYTGTKYKFDSSTNKYVEDSEGTYRKATNPDKTLKTKTGKISKSENTITVQHSSSTSSSLADLDFWKRIAYAYTSEEIANHVDEVALESDIAPKFQDETVSGIAVTSVTKGGKVKERTLYARASSDYHPAGDTSGYFLYVKSSNTSSTVGLQTYHEKSDSIIYNNLGDVDTTTYHDYSKDFYVVADLNQNPYNVVVYYRSVGMGSALTYNGNTRYAPLTLKASEVGYLASVPSGQNTGRVGTYSYLLSGAGGTARNVGTYTTNITLYYYDSTGYPYEVGSVSNGEWRIVARQLQAGVASSGKREYDGTSTEGYVDVEVSNFELNDATNATVRIIFSPSSGNHSIETGTYTYIYTMGSVSAPIGEGGASSKYITPFGNVTLTTENPIAGDDTFNTIDNPILNTYKATIRFKITNALSYTVLVDQFEGKTSEITNDYTMNSQTGTITVQAKELEITFKDGGSHQYDGSEFSNDIIISNWATSDSSSSARQDWFASFFPYYKDNTGAVVYYKNYKDATNNSDPTVALVTTGGVSKVSVKGTNKGTYYFGFNSSKTTSTSTIGTSTSEIYSSDGNYKIKLNPNNPKAVLQIAENSLTLEFKSTDKTYDTNTTTITATFTAKYDLADTTKWDIVLDDYQYSILSKTDSTKNVPSVAISKVWTSKKVATITFTTHKNADTYIAQILGPKVTNENCPVDLTASPTTGSQVSGRDRWVGEVTIKKKALTVNSTSTTQPSGGYVYNTYYQGVETLTVTGFAGSETISNTGAYGSGNGTAVHVSNSSLKSTQTSTGYTITGDGDAGTYTVYVYLTSSTTSNYSIARQDKTWTIKKKVISLGTGTTTSSTYTGYKQTIPAVWGTNAGLSGDGATRTYNQDTIYIAFTYKDSGASSSTGSEYICNVGTYSMSIASANSVTATRSGKDKSANYELDDASTHYTATHEITPVTVTVGFDGNISFVYTGNQQGPKISTAKANGTNLTFKSSSFEDSKFAGLHSSETLTIALSGSGNVSASNSAYNATTGLLTVEGTNEGGATSSSNYQLTANTQAYNINKSKIKIEMSASTLTKVYDGNTNAVIGLSALTIKSTNDGAVLPSSAIQDNNTTVQEKVAGNLYGTYDTKNVGTAKTVTFSINNTSTTNFVLVDNSGNETNTIPSLQIKTGVITVRPVTIDLNLTRNKATKTYDGTVEFATYNNKTAVDGKTSKYKSGQGFIVSNVVVNDDFIVTGSFRESDTNRSYFDAFINNITREGTSGNYTYMTTTGKFKMLEFVVSSGTGIDYLNYTVAITGFTNTKAISDATGGNVIYVYDSSETESSKKNAITSTTIAISITAKTIQATYNNTTQSYANDDNSFNLNWKAVTGTPTAGLSADGVSFAMVNGWMYKTGIDPNANSTGVDISDTSLAQTYKKYTTIRGYANSQTLSAKLISTNGKHLNYILRQQPTLTIGYFVNQNGYEINSYAGLMMATYYYSTNFMQTTYDDESIATATLITTWNTTFAYGGVNITCSYSDYETNTLPNSIKNDFETWDEFFDAFRAAYNEGKDAKFQIAVDGIKYEGEGESGAWGYWVDVAEPRTTYLEFRQTKNIDARLTANDIAIIEGQFGSTWGYGTKYLSNFIKCSAGEVCVAINAIFPIIKVSGGKTYGFVGTYNGNGYTINNMTIIANYIPGFSYGEDSIYEQLNHGTYHNASSGGVGMFALVNSATLPDFTNKTAVQNGGVYGVNLRNAMISVNDSIATTNNSTLAVGGIIGVSQMTTTMTSCSFHGSINVNTNGTRNHIGGIVGLYIQPNADIVTMIEGAIVTGTITEHQASGSNAASEEQPGCGDIGGIVGRAVGITASKNLKIKDVVTVAQILAVIAHNKPSANNIGGIIGTAFNTASTFITGTAAYLTDSALRVLTGATELMNNSIGYTNNGSGSNLGVSYDTLRSGSTSAYAATVYSPTLLARGTYDVMAENGASVQDTRISSRLVDIIDIYMLMYNLETAEVGETGAEVTITKKLTTSSLVGTKTGTTSDRINIVNQQHVALIRELPFLNFNLTCNVSMYATHSADVFEGFFFGSIQNDGNYKIYLANNSVNSMFKWNITGHSVPTSIKQSA